MPVLELLSGAGGVCLTAVTDDVSIQLFVKTVLRLRRGVIYNPRAFGPHSNRGVIERRGCCIHSPGMSSLLGLSWRFHPWGDSSRTPGLFLKQRQRRDRVLGLHQWFIHSGSILYRSVLVSLLLCASLRSYLLWSICIIRHSPHTLHAKCFIMVHIYSEYHSWEKKVRWRVFGGESARD